MNNDNLWAPWRMAYLRDLERKREQVGSPEPKSSNFFAEYWDRPQDDETNHVVYRNEHGIILLNRYPYANGHLLVALGEPRSELLAYEASQRQAFWTLLETATQLQQHTLRPQGVNIGINQGEAAGAGVPAHLHAHVVPRWAGDTNFITVVGQVRVIPDALEKMAQQYREMAGQLFG